MPNLSVKEAVHIAKAFVEDVLGEESPINIGLEEIAFSETENLWKVTIGFSRPWNTTRGAFSTITGDQASRRDYRMIAIHDQTREPVSMTKRELADSR